MPTAIATLRSLSMIVKRKHSEMNSHVLAKTKYPSSFKTQPLMSGGNPWVGLSLSLSYFNLFLRTTDGFRTESLVMAF